MRLNDKKKIKTGKWQMLLHASFMSAALRLKSFLSIFAA